MQSLCLDALLSRGPVRKSTRGRLSGKIQLARMYNLQRRRLRHPPALKITRRRGHLLRRHAVVFPLDALLQQLGVLEHGRVFHPYHALVHIPHGQRRRKLGILPPLVALGHVGAHPRRVPLDPVHLLMLPQVPLAVEALQHHLAREEAELAPVLRLGVHALVEALDVVGGDFLGQALALALRLVVALDKLCPGADHAEDVELGAGEGDGVVGRDDLAVPLLGVVGVRHDEGRGADLGRDNGHARERRLANGQREALGDGRVHEDPRVLEDLFGLAEAGEDDVFREVVLDDELGHLERVRRLPVLGAVHHEPVVLEAVAVDDDVGRQDGRLDALDELDVGQHHGRGLARAHLVDGLERVHVADAVDNGVDLAAKQVAVANVAPVAADFRFPHAI